MTILRNLNFDFRENDKSIVGPCPVHGGDNPSAFNLNIDEDSEHFGMWFCNTHGCHINYYGITGFLKLMVDCDWETAQNIYSTKRNKNDPFTKFFSRKNKNIRYLCSRDYVRSRLLIPPDYYINKGFSKEVLDEFDIGLCHDRRMQMYNRVVFPVYVNNHLVGCAGRTINNNPKKWLNSKGFNKSAFLYGFWKTEKYIREEKDIILVEGQGDVIKLFESGIRNVVGIFGTSLSDSQEFLIQKSGAMRLGILMDNDDAGNKARENIRRQTENLFNVYDIYSEKDPGDMTYLEINEIIKPQL